MSDTDHVFFALLFQTQPFPGPYVYNEHHKKVHEAWYNDTVTFEQVKTWDFDPDASGGSEDDMVTNLGMVAMVRKNRHYNPTSAVECKTSTNSVVINPVKIA